MTSDAAVPDRLLLRRGTRIRSVEMAFDARALNEVNFRPSGSVDESAEAFDARMEPVESFHLATEVDGPVQAEAEARLLAELELKVLDCLAGLPPGGVLVVESAPGVDWPKTRERRKDVIVQGENRYHFHWRVEPALRLVSYRRRDG